MITNVKDIWAFGGAVSQDIAKKSAQRTTEDVPWALLAKTSTLTWVLCEALRGADLGLGALE